MDHFSIAIVDHFSIDIYTAGARNKRTRSKQTDLGFQEYEYMKT